MKFSFFIEPCGNPLSPPLQTASLGRRIVPKEKRRHHTAPDNNHISRDLSLLSASDGDTSSVRKFCMFSLLVREKDSLIRST